MPIHRGLGLTQYGLLTHVSSLRTPILIYRVSCRRAIQLIIHCVGISFIHLSWDGLSYFHCSNHSMGQSVSLWGCFKCHMGVLWGSPKKIRKLVHQDYWHSSVLITFFYTSPYVTMTIQWLVLLPISPYITLSYTIPRYANTYTISHSYSYSL